jgi:predicted phosphodiesterase
MKCIKVNLPETLDHIKIEIFADLHIGSKKCNYKSIMERVEKVKNEENRYCIFVGDLINNSTKSSVGDVYSEELSPMQQIQKAVKMFDCIKHKTIGITSGNHEQRSYKTDGIDLTYFFARELGLEHLYDYCACLLFIRFGKAKCHGAGGSHGGKLCYTLYMTHGNGNGGRTIGGKMNGLQRRGQIVDADIIVTAHTHSPASFRDCFYRIDYQNSSVSKREQLFINASAALNYEEYAEQYGMRPSSLEAPIAWLDGRKKFAQAIM